MWFSAIEKTTLANKACYHQGRPGWHSALKLPNWLGGINFGKELCMRVAEVHISMGS